MNTHIRTDKEEIEDLRNEDPLSGEASAHPVGSGMGTALGGAIAGAAAGLVAGPVGTVAGAVVGGVAGGLAGKAAAEAIHPTIEVAYWQDAHIDRPAAQDADD
jgi:phage tail tape-measure protein